MYDDCQLSEDDPMTIRQLPALVPVLALLILFNTGLRAQDLVEDQEIEKPWIFSAGGGAAYPIAPDYFSGQWKTGTILVGSAEYLLTPSISVGTSFSRSVFPHTGKSLPYREQPFKCLGGGTRSFTSSEVRMRFYLLDDAALRLSVAGGIGATNIFRDNVSYHSNGFTMVMMAESSMHVAGMVAIGAEIPIPIMRDLALALEAGYGIAEDGIWLNHYTPLTAALRFRL
jgi:hypothetical protein